MKIEEIRDYPNPNFYSHRPVLRARLDLEELEEYPTSQLGDFGERLLRVLPGLAEHTCSRGYPGGFVERVKEGTYLGHVIEHVAIELQHQLGEGVNYGSTRSTGRKGVYDVIVAYRCRQVGEEAIHLAVGLVQDLVEGKEPRLEDRLQRLREVKNRHALGPSTQAIVEAALARNIPVIRLSEHASLLQLGYGCYRRLIQATMTDQTSAIGVDISCDKWLTKQLLRDHRIPVPEGGLAETEEEAVNLARRLGGAVVVKPYNGNQGKGVSISLTQPQEVRLAFRIARGYSPQVLVEQYIRGRDYRLLVVGGRVVAAAERIPARVVGDGIHTVGELIDLLNQDPRRGDDHELPLTKVRVDPMTIMLLARQGLTLDTVLEVGREAYLRENGNLSTGGTPVDVTALVHPRNEELAVRAVQAVGLDIAGVDVVTPDISVPLDESGGAVIEVNAAPGLRMHLFPSQGEPTDVAGAIVEMLFPPGRPSRIPVVSVTGTNGKTTTTRMIGQILAQTGRRVGMTTSDGIYIGGVKVVAGDTTGPWSAQVVLRDPMVEVAVLETARGGILRGGLGYDRSRVGVVTNISEDHLGQDGIETLEDMAHLKALVVECVEPEGWVVLNADDPLVREMIRRTRAQVIYFTVEMDAPFIREWREKGGRVVALVGDEVVCLQGKEQTPVIKVHDIPATFGGLAWHNVLNALAAVGAGWALGVPWSQIRTALSGFSCDPACNPGRLNVLEVGRVQVVVDYGHNPAGLAAMGRTLRHLKRQGRLIGVIAAPGDRRNETIQRVGWEAGKIFDLLYIKEDGDLRGRRPGEVAALLKAGALEAGLPAERIQVVLEERQAVRMALTAARPGDTVAVFYEKYDLVMEEITSLKAGRHGAALDEKCRLVAAAIARDSVR